MSQQIIKLEAFFKNTKQQEKEKNTYVKGSTDHNALNARVGDARASIHIFNSKDVIKRGKNGNEHLGVIRRTWSLGNPQTYASF